MDYVLGSVAALVTGNVTPSRPKLLKRALTPTKHQPSPNVTPKSEFVEDRSIFLSPSMQKKKAIVKKSPKRIFQNPDLETTDNGDGNSSLSSPKADKVKKHLKDDLECDSGVNKSVELKSPKNKAKNKKLSITPQDINYTVSEQNSNENTPQKKKKKSNSVYENLEESTDVQSSQPITDVSTAKSPKKTKQMRKPVIDDESNKENDSKEIRKELLLSDIAKPQTNTSENTETSQDTIQNTTPKKKNKKRKKKPKQQIVDVKSESTDNIAEETNKENVENKTDTPKKKNRKRKKSKSKQEAMAIDQSEEKDEDHEMDIQNKNTNKDNKTKNEAEDKTESSITKKKNRKRKKSKLEQNQKLEPKESELPVTEETDDEDDDNTDSKKSKSTVNPNAITDKESDSEHESDDEIESENEEINKKVFESEPNADESSDEEEESKKDEPKKQKVDKKEVNKDRSEINTEDEIKRTLFVGNVPFSAKCKKEIKKIFNKHGQIETIRIRTVPVKDGRYTPKLAVIKNELHPERTTVNVYIKYADEESIEKALAENNTVLNDHHLRVSRSSQTGAEHDPKCSIFVGNLPFAMEDEVLRQKFEKCGEIESVRIIRDKKTNAGKGFGYVNFASKDGVELALELTEEDLTIKNRIIRVKRCTQLTNKQKQPSENKGKGVFKKQFNQRPNQNLQGQKQNQDGQRGFQGGQRGFQGGQKGFQGGQRGFQGGQRGFQGGQRGNQSGERGFQGGQRGNQAGQRWNQGGPRQGINNEEGKDGAHRRIMNKRKNQDGGGGDGPPNKRQKNINQPGKEKKVRKEFVGMTAEKKKKHKFDKGQKKKKALSEILTK